jgi:CheY-like chemotaxis protein
MAGDAVSALEAMRDFHPEAAVLDLGLPVLDGFELARKIREEFPTRTPRLIAVTGYGQQHDRERSADVGFADHLVKPIDMKAMVAALERPSA